MSRRGKKRVTCSGIFLSIFKIHCAAPLRRRFFPGTMSVVTSTCVFFTQYAIVSLATSESPPKISYRSRVNPFRSMFIASMCGSTFSITLTPTQPFVTTTFFMPKERTRRDASRTYSHDTSGSLYVYATPILPRGTSDKAFSARDSGETYAVSMSPPLCEISAFWQNGQCILQPKLPADKIMLPEKNR